MAILVTFSNFNQARIRSDRFETCHRLSASTSDLPELSAAFKMHTAARFLGFLSFPILTLDEFAIAFVSSLFVFPLLDISSFPRTDVGQFVISVKAFWGRN